MPLPVQHVRHIVRSVTSSDNNTHIEPGASRSAAAKDNTIKSNTLSKFDKATSNIYKVTVGVNAMTISGNLLQLGRVDDSEIDGADEVRVPAI